MRARTIRCVIALTVAAALVSACGDPAPGRPARPVVSAANPAPAPAQAVDPAAPAPPAPGPSGSSTSPDQPVRVSIAAIGVTSRLVRLGLDADGALQVPADFSTAGWLTSSARPGARGPMIIAGHVDSRTGPAVFYRLRKLQPGAKIVVTTRSGRAVTYTVDEIGQYDKNHFPSDAVYGPAPAPVLRLITCGGPFDRSTGHYQDNVVVFAS